MVVTNLSGKEYVVFIILAVRLYLIEKCLEITNIDVGGSDGVACMAAE